MSEAVSSGCVRTDMSNVLVIGSGAAGLRASLVTAEASLLGAVERRESRGAHQRSDLDPALKVNLVVSKAPDGHLAVSQNPVPPVPEHLRGWAHGGDEIEAAGRLLE